MKKMLYLALAVMTVGLVASCSSGSSSPGKAAKQYAEYMAKGDYDKFVNGIAFDEDATKEEIEEGKTMVKSLLTEKMKPALEEKGGMKSIEVLSEDISDDGNSADVELKYTYGNGETEENEFNMVLVKGKWMMEMDK